MPRVIERNQRVTIQHKTATVTSGQESVNWTASTTGPLWASMRWLRGRELEAMRQRWAKADFLLVLNFGDVSGVTINPYDRISWGSRTLEIDGGEDPDDRRRYYNIIAHEIK